MPENNPITERDRLREKGKLIYNMCPDPENWSCVLAFLDKHIAERTIVVKDFLQFLQSEIQQLEKKNQHPRLEQTKNLLNIVKEKLKK